MDQCIRVFKIPTEKYLVNNLIISIIRIEKRISNLVYLNIPTDAAN
ncbi:hypothetical protein BML2526_25570 [Providencia rettgeri]|nr:hypothetical protein BML2496_26650 [Providencia rettgeri]BBV00905.1 hypothetical protein BML2526_25570 [Providencia rettgeri]BBV11983.1 hypothetical protein BML2576_14420 [Providencia rettgeri]BDH18111.1 hypothetical protein PrNR1418_14020 [Providencia rettgeri]